MVVVDNPMLIGISSIVHDGGKIDTRETCWELVGKPRDFRDATATASPAESAKWNGNTND